MSQIKFYYQKEGGNTHSFFYKRIKQWSTVAVRKLLINKGWSNNTKGRARALHVASPGLTPSTPSVPPNPTGSDPGAHKQESTLTKHSQVWPQNKTMNPRSVVLKVHGQCQSNFFGLWKKVFLLTLNTWFSFYNIRVKN